MSADENKHHDPKNSGSQVLSFLEVKEFQARMIPQALVFLLNTLGECRYLLQRAHSSQSGPISSAVPEYGKNLSARDRRVLDQTFNEYAIEVEKELSRKFSSEAMNSEDNVHNPIYPLSPETEGFAFSLIFEEIDKKLLDKYFSKWADDPVSGEYIIAKLKLGPDLSREIIEGTALLPLIVSKAEEFLGAIVRTGLNIYPNALGEPPSVPNDIFTKYQQNISSADIKRWQIDYQVAQFLKGSPDEWSRVLDRWTKINITNVGADWDMLNEMIQRRHAVIHNGGRADADYLAKISPALRKGLYPGSNLVCSFAYMDPVLIELETWATCIALRFNKHFFEEDRTVYREIMETVTRLQSLGRWTQALAILDSFLLEPIPVDSEDLILARINRWFCLQELGKDNESVQREIRSWRADKSVSPQAAKYLELGRLALLRDFDELIPAMNQFIVGGDARKNKLRLKDMPLIQRAIQESPRIRSYFKSGKPSSSKNVRNSASRGTRKRSRG